MSASASPPIRTPQLETPMEVPLEERNGQAMGGPTEGIGDGGEIEDIDEEQASRLRRRREALQNRMEITLLEQQLATLRRRDNAGYTPVGSSLAEGDFDDRASVVTSAPSATAVRRGPASRPRLREPDTFKGKTLKEARDFIRSLELVFALAPEAYQTEQEKVLYGVMFLAGEPRETWHQNNSVSHLEAYSWADFNVFVLDAVEDPVNRSLSTTVAYETARQGEGQSVQAFATELATLEEQMDPYTAEQRTRHLLAKLKPALRTAIITYHEVPKRREDLVSLATRLESAGKRIDVAVQRPLKREAGESQHSRGQKRRFSPARPSVNATAPKPTSRPVASGAPQGHGPECYGCHERGHIRAECPRGSRRMPGDSASARKVAAGPAPKKAAKKPST